jgi:hypothetical protein
MFGTPVSKPQDRRRDGLRYRFELLGETIREIGTLLLVFVPLDSTLHDGRLGRMKTGTLVALGIAGFILTYAGIRIEGRD